MTAAQLKKTTQIIKHSQAISILPCLEFQKHNFPLVLALYYSLQKLGKNVNLLTENEPERFHFLLNKPGNNFCPAPPEANFMISIKEAGAKISELSYEKTDNGLNLFFKTDNNNLQEQDVSFKSLRGQRPELLITVGTNNFSSPDILPNAQSNIIANIDNEDDLHAIIAELCELPSKSPVWLFNRILNKLMLDEKQGLAWALVNWQDFEQTNTLPSALKFALNGLTSDIFPFQNLLLLWEQTSSPVSVRGVFYSQNKRLVSKMLSGFEHIHVHAEQKGNGILFNTSEMDLNRAKDRISEILKE